MRITNGILQRTTLAGIQQNLRELRAATDRAVSGTRIHVASDDPGTAGTVLRADSQLRALEQYQRNIATARARLTTEEDILNQVTDLLSRARELAMRESSGAANASTHEIALVEADHLLEAAIQLANTSFDGLYLFGGDSADLAPVDADGTFRSNDLEDTHRVEIATGQVVYTNHNANRIFGDDTEGVIAALRSLSEALGTDDANTAQAITDAGQAIGEALSHVQTLIGDVGTRVIRLDMAQANIEALDINLRVFRSDLSEVEFEEAITDLVGRQTALQAAYVSTSRILQTTIMDYLR